jgi:Zn-dependent protease
MRDFLSWNFYLGPVRGVQVRLHVFFLLLAVLILAGPHKPDDVPFGYRVACVAVLLLAVVFHELGHCFASHKLGYGPKRVILWPFGGLEPCPCEHDPQHEWATAAAGMLANFLICLITFASLLAARKLELISLNPLAPPAPGEMTWELLFGLVFWFNWMLVLVNLLPAFPLDGAQVLRAMLWPHFGYRTAKLQVAWFAKITAIVLAVVALVLYDQADQYRFATVPLLVLAIFLYFAARQEAERLQDHDGEEGLFGYDFSQGYTSLERAVEPKHKRPRLAPLWHWLEERRESRLRRQQEIEEQEDARMDDVLAQLHRYGLEGLSSEDRALLDRVSARYRSRLRS